MGRVARGRADRPGVQRRRGRILRRPGLEPGRDPFGFLVTSYVLGVEKVAIIPGCCSETTHDDCPIVASPHSFCQPSSRAITNELGRRPPRRRDARARSLAEAPNLGPFVGTGVPCLVAKIVFKKDFASMENRVRSSLSKRCLGWPLGPCLGSDLGPPCRLGRDPARGDVPARRAVESSDVDHVGIAEEAFRCSRVVKERRTFSSRMVRLGAARFQESPRPDDFSPGRRVDQPRATAGIW